MNQASFLPLTNAKIHKAKSLFDYNQVSYLAADINYTKVHFKNGSSLLIPYTIKHFEMYLSDNQDFKRIHRGFIINQNCIKEVSDFEVLMCCGRRLPIARRRKFPENPNSNHIPKL